MRYRRREPYKKVPKEEWCESKVKEFYPSCPEKGTLVALAHQAELDGSGVFLSYATIARDTGQSVRTCKRHVKALALRGDLQVTCELKSNVRTNRYKITMDGAGGAAREAMLGVSVKQLRLPLASTYLGENYEPGQRSERHWGSGQHVTGGSDTVSPNHDLNMKLPEEKKSFKNSSVDQDYSVEGPISEKTRKMIAETLENLRMGADLDAIQEGYTIAPLIFGGDGEG